MTIMKEYRAQEAGGVIHCYSYSPEMAKQYVDMGFFIGVGGVITFNNARKLRETVELIPLESIVLETDAPYLAPQPYRGKQNSSLYLPLVAQEIANIKGIDIETVYEKTYENARRLYKI
jgi:TatD DNase family protein